MTQRYWVKAALVTAALFLVVGTGWYYFARFSVGIDCFFPNVARPGEKVYLLVRNLRGSTHPKVYFGGIQIEVTDVREHRSGISVVTIRIPGIVGQAPITIVKAAPNVLPIFSRFLGAATTPEALKVIRSDTVRYPKDAPYVLKNPVGLPNITPFGPQRILVVAGVPADIQPQFAVGDLDAAIQTRYADVNSYFSTISKNTVSLSASLYPQFIPLTQKYADYIFESRLPVARGTPIHYPIDLTSYTDPNLSLDVEGPDGVVHTISLSLNNLPSGTWSNVQWYNAWQILFVGGTDVILPYFVDHGSGNISVDLCPYGTGVGTANPEYFMGDGYRIVALNGPAWAAFGLAPTQVQLVNGSGIGANDSRTGMDRASANWIDEIQTALDATGIDLSTYSSINYMLVGAPVLDGNITFMDLNSIGYLESHSLRSAATIGYGWMRLPHDVDWMVWAHETGHNLGLTDEYREDLNQPGAFMNGWTLMAYHFYASHITAWEKGPRIGELTTGGSWLPPSSILQAAPPGPSGSVITTTVILAPQYDPIPTLPGYVDPIGYAAEIKLSPSHSIFLEGRQNQPETTPRRYDDQLDQIDTMSGNGGVIVYDVRDWPLGGEWPNVYRREMILLSPYDDALDSGTSSYSDASTGVGVRILQEIGSGQTRSFRTAIDWGRPAPPSGQRFDAYITPWDATYQSPDIWVDSPLNGYDNYESTARTADGDPDGAGDTIAVGEENRLYARIRNIGPETIPSATVTFWVATPAGIGDRGDWQRLDPVTIGPIPAGGSTKAFTIWIPLGSGHTCVKAEVTPIEGEISFTNNLAQENFTNFEVVSSSPYEALKFRFDLFNSADEPRQFALRARRLIPSIGVRLDHAYPVVPAKRSLTVNGELRLNEKVPPGLKSDTFVSIAAFAPRHDSEVKLGGITLNLKPRRISSIDMALKRGRDSVVASGIVKGGNMPRLVILSVHGVEPNLSKTYIQTKTDSNGYFVAKIPIKDKGALDIYAFAPGVGDYASARSKTIRLQ